MLKYCFMWTDVSQNRLFTDSDHVAIAVLGNGWVTCADGMWGGVNLCACYLLLWRHPVLEVWFSRVEFSADVWLVDGGGRLSGGGAESPAGAQREGAAGDEGRSRRAQLTQTTELPTAKQGAQTHKTGQNNTFMPCRHLFLLHWWRVERLAIGSFICLWLHY